jgi:predicted lactoylglutathione lyase
MNLFKKRISSSEMGAIIFEVTRNWIKHHTKGFLSELGMQPNQEYESRCIVEIFIYFLFGVLLIIKKKYDDPIADYIMDVVKEHFMITAKEIKNESELEQLFVNRFLQYYSCLENKSGAGPMWHLSKQFYWNIIGREEMSAIAIYKVGIYFNAFLKTIEKITSKFRIVEK